VRAAPPALEKDELKLGFIKLTGRQAGAPDQGGRAEARRRLVPGGR
jgi:hypothetical protein